ncbi:MAG TPA: VTT domain-containing protein, partial [Chloroflexota bacterium]|nr:VTT domain-containing protein [Chloroflexota bacterium]
MTQSLATFLEVYGLTAIFVVMLIKSIGVPIPIPSDVIMLVAAAGAVQGRFVFWQAFVAILIALVAGGAVQYVLARGPGRGFIYRNGRYVGLSPGRLDAASALARRSGLVGVSLMVLLPGVRAAAVAACGLAALPARLFVPALLIGNAGFLGLHFFIGYAGGTLLRMLAQPVSPLTAAIAVVLLLLIGFVVWFEITRHRSRPG